MMIRRLMPILCLLVASGIPVADLPAMAPPPAELTVLVVPERYSVIQTAFDVKSHRPVALVAYRGEPDTRHPTLHVWDNGQWVHISLEDYRRAAVFRALPRRVILIGDESIRPAILDTASEWAPEVVIVPELDSISLINRLGGILAFTPREWRWFARQYNLEMEDVTVDRRRESWYDQASFERPERRPRRERERPRPERTPPPPEPRERETTPPPWTMTPEIRETRPAAPAAERRRVPDEDDERPIK